MRATRRLALAAIAVVLAGCDALAQTANPPVPPATDAAPPLTKEADEKAWSFYASAYGYIVPESQDFVQPSFMADRGWLHLEARYNYEDLRTGSLWLGYNFSAGEKLALEFTAMLGGVMGDTAGLAPGYRFSLTCWKLELASEAEYVFDSRDSADNFFYNWSELSISAPDWFRAGLVVQRTKLYQTEFDIQRGFLVGFTYKKAGFTAYVFNPDASQPTVVLSVGLDF
jgi:hypothetical protein